MDSRIRGNDMGINLFLLNYYFVSMLGVFYEAICSPAIYSGRK